MQVGDYVVHVVDDEEPVRKSLAFLLATAGFPVRVHESATGFLAVAQTIGNGGVRMEPRLVAKVIDPDGRTVDEPLPEEAERVMSADTAAKVGTTWTQQIVNLLLDLRERSGLSYLFISHDVAVVARIADRISVFYLGRVVEEGPSREVTLRPLHPYTAALVSAAPDADPFGTRRRIALAGSPPSAVTPPGGCPFHPRCPIARERCREERPELREVAPGRTAACFYPGEMP